MTSPLERQLLLRLRLRAPSGPDTLERKGPPGFEGAEEPGITRMIRALRLGAHAYTLIGMEGLLIDTLFP